MNSKSLFFSVMMCSKPQMIKHQVLTMWRMLFIEYLRDVERVDTCRPTLYMLIVICTYMYMYMYRVGLHAIHEGSIFHKNSNFLMSR